MYLSHPVRRLRDDPPAEKSVGLVVTATAEEVCDLEGIESVETAQTRV